MGIEKLTLIPMLILVLSKNTCALTLPSGCFWEQNNYLQCSNAGFKNVPRNIPQSTISIDLSGNPGIKFQKDFFARFYNLQRLYLNGCVLKDAFLTPLSLTELYIRQNAFTDGPAIKVFKNLSSTLRTLDIGNNKLLSLEKVLKFVPKSVEVLQIGENKLSTIPRNLFSHFKSLIFLNMSHCGVNKIEKNGFDFLIQLKTLYLAYNNLRETPKKLFRFLKNLRLISLESNEFSKPPSMYGLRTLMQLELNNNRIEKLLPTDLQGLIISRLLLRANKIRTFNLRNTKYFEIHLSYNRLKRLEAFSFKGNRNIKSISLQNNSISYISPQTFQGLHQVMYLHLERNKITSIPRKVFENISMKSLFAFGNNISSMEGVFENMKSAPTLLLLFANPPLKNLKLKEFRTMSNESNIYASCKNLMEVTNYAESKANIKCFPSKYFSIIDGERSLSEDGYNCTFHPPTNYVCVPCPAGYITDHSKVPITCRKCPPGSFYQDELALTYCKSCPSGQYVPPESSPGKSPLDCLTCPDGTKKKQSAGYRACACLDGFARTDRFGECRKCDITGIKCSRDYPVLKKGYWWIWHDQTPSNYTCKKFFIDFTRNLDTNSDEYNRSSSKFTCSLPSPHACPVKASCLGGINATCLANYTGPLCAVCNKGYSRQFNRCAKCPKPVYSVLLFIAYILLFVCICAVVFWSDASSSESAPKRTFSEVMLSNLKIFLGFYQVLVAVIQAFAYVNWPRSMQTTIGLLLFVQMEIFRVPSLRCIKPDWELNAVSEFWVALIGTFAFPLLVLLYFAVKMAYLYATKQSDEVQKSMRKCMKVVVLFLFVTYPVTSQRIIQILPISCKHICVSMAKGRCLHYLSYLKSDYSVKCLSLSGGDESNPMALIVAIVAMVIPFGFPLILLCLLRKYLARDSTPTEEQSALQGALRFLHENYDKDNKYWEPLEMLRKLIMTAGVTFFAGYYKIGIGSIIILAGFFAILHAYRKPIEDGFENKLQLLSLSVIPINLCLATILKSSSIAGQGDGRLHPEEDNAAIGYVMVVLNISVFVLVLIRLAKHLVEHGCPCCCHCNCNCFKRRSNGADDSTPLM
eukprot:gene9160-10133_t